MSAGSQSNSGDEVVTVDMALAALELRLPVNVESIAEARRRLAKRAHPDAGGTTEQMRRLNAAADVLLAECARAEGRSNQAWSTTNHAASNNGPGDASGVNLAVDHPSFVIEALPAEAFEALLIVAGWLGDVIDEDPPYRLEVALVDPPSPLPRDIWCQLTLVPDAGGSTVSLTIGSAPGRSGSGREIDPARDAELVRDLWVASLNQLDWDDLPLL